MAQTRRAGTRRTPRAVESASDREPFDIDVAIDRLRKAVEPYPKAALFELAGEGYTSVFEILVACILSIRTRVAIVSQL